MRSLGQDIVAFDKSTNRMILKKLVNMPIPKSDVEKEAYKLYDIQIVEKGTCEGKYLLPEGWFAVLMEDDEVFIIHPDGTVRFHIIGRVNLMICCRFHGFIEQTQTELIAKVWDNKHGIVLEGYEKIDFIVPNTDDITMTMKINQLQNDLVKLVELDYPDFKKINAYWEED